MSARRVSLLILGLGLAAFAATRAFHPVHGIGNPDIGGILYSADTINAGLLPYRDTVDVKQPGSFFLIAGIFRVSRSILALQIGFAAWLLVGAPAIWVAARALYGRVGRAELSPAIATAIYLVQSAAFDLNYAAWMMVPYAWAFASLVKALRAPSVVWAVLAGAFATVAYTFKAQAVVLLPLYVAVWLLARRTKQGGATLRTWLGLTAGAAVALVPLVAVYAHGGALRELAAGLVPLSDASAYSAKRVAATSDLAALWKVPRQQGRVFFVPLVLGLAGLIGYWRARRAHSESPSPVPALLFYGASLLGCGIGGRRFFVHYLAQCLPALALLAAHPGAIDWLLARRAELGSRVWLVGARLHTALAGGLLLFLLGRIPFHKNAVVDNPGSPHVEQAGRYVREHSTSDEPLLVWGWAGWGSYYYAERRSPSRIFKVLGQVTEYNDNTAFSRGTSIAFKPGPHADMLLADLRAHPPSFIIRATPFFPGTTGDPLDEWPELRAMVNRDYKQATRFGHLIVYERRRRPRPPARSPLTE
jgi:hypothetical protein